MRATEPAADSASSGRGIRLMDLIGFVAGFGLASLLIRAIWPRLDGLSGPPLVALGLEFCWLGVAMSGPIVLGLDSRRPSRLPPRRPDRPGRWIGEVAAGLQDEERPTIRPPVPSLEDSDQGLQHTRAELAWMLIGGYWIALTLFIVPARMSAAPWTLAGVVPIIAVFVLVRLLPRPRSKTLTTTAGRWTHTVGQGLLWTWPIAWGLLSLLGRTL